MANKGGADALKGGSLIGPLEEGEKPLCPQGVFKNNAWEKKLSKEKRKQKISYVKNQGKCTT